ncbi:hypothetical protein [Flavobacterium glaciei]|uniref:Uncharacterized protein n=1 Tax=Flavobacterium glaciei TaxID=386300 RepID=A0A562PJJ0_9FLAO|nr:hypothetical protein [Flavobacterium glaciei]RDI50349.1 hypothetical protein DFR66_11711 [Flavobacterium glaciei]TWI44632.1 hypothetical protein IQ02_02524 [Flavobacterium glaciei]
MSLLGVKLIQESKHVDKYIKDNGLLIKDEENTELKQLEIPESKIKEFIKLNEKVDTTNLAYSLLPINFVVSFVSQYDAYLGGLIRVMFLNKPEFLNNSEKNIMFSELLKFNSIEEAQEFVVEKEVESVLRESHIKQFKWLENKLGIPLRKDLLSFSDFIEITERRNLFVHCNGAISRQYIENCKENGVKGIDELKIDDLLDAKPAYFSKCYMTLFEIGVKLGHVIWRKLKPEENNEADGHLNEVCYELLINGHYKLAINLLTFATETLKKHTQEMVCVFTINKALAYYLSNKKQDCIKVIDKHDWSATNDKFKLAIEILKENYPESLEIMRSIGNKNEHLNAEAYLDWPLFNEIRKTAEFKQTYKEIFGEELIYKETKPRDLEDILTELKQIRKETEEAQNAENDEIIEEVESINEEAESIMEE